MNFEDKGHYYVDHQLIDGMTITECRKAGGIVSVTTKLDFFNPLSLVFWKINQNIESAYNCIQSASEQSVSMDEWKIMVRNEFYKNNNQLSVGSATHDFIASIIKNGIQPSIFSEFFDQYATKEIDHMKMAIKLAINWFNNTTKLGEVEKIVYDKELGVAGTVDYSGVIKDPNGNEVIGGIDWKTKSINKHPGYKKNGETKAVPWYKDKRHQQQLGAYARIAKWQGAYIVYISTNYIIPVIKAIWYDKEDLIKGWKMYSAISNAFDYCNGFKE